MISELGREKMLLDLSYDERTIPHLEAKVAAWSMQQFHLGGTLEEWAARDYKPAQVVLLLRNQRQVDLKRKIKEAV